MLVLNLSETQQVSGGHWVVDENSTAPVAAGYIAGLFSVLDTADMMNCDIDKGDVIDLTIAFGIYDQTFTAEELEAGLNSLKWV